MFISKVELTKQLKGLGIKITGGCIRKSDILKLFEAHAVSPKANKPPRMLDKGYRGAKKDAKGIGASIVSNEHYQRMLDDVADALLEAEEDLKKAVDSYSDMENDDPAMEKKIERLELERDRAKKSYENALEVTLEDLRKESAYETWKETR